MIRRNGPRMLGDLLLSFAALLGGLGIMLLVAGATMGVRPLLFRSGSMAPTIGTGDIALARSVPASALRVGDIVSVLDTDGQRVTHRIAAIDGTGDTRSLRLRGDANQTSDPAPYPVSRADRVFFTVHGAGRVVALASTPVGMFVPGLYAAGLLVLVFRGSGPLRDERSPRGKRSARRPVAATVAVAAVAAVLPAGSADASPWTDTVSVGGQLLTASTVPATTLSCGALGVLSVTFDWTAVAGATSYTLHYGNGQTVDTTVTTKTIVSAISGGTAWVEVNHDYGASTWTSAPSNTRSYTVAVVSLCS